MSVGAFSLKKAIPIILITWILSLVTTLALVYVSPSIFPPLGTANIEDSAITAAKIADNAIVTVKLSDGTVTSAKILDGTINAQDLMDGSILTIKVADGAITADKISNSSVTSGKIAEGAIITVKLADNSITSAKILDGTIVGEDLANSAIVTIKVADGAITTSKIADGAVTNTKLAANAIPYAAVYNTSLVSTMSTSFVDIPDTSLEITLGRRSNLIIMFTAEAWVDGAGDSLYVRALVDSTVANPNSGSQILLTSAGSSQHGSYAINFYLENVDAGTYTIKMQWSEMLGANFAHVADRTLNVIALPA